MPCVCRDRDVVGESKRERNIMCCRGIEIRISNLSVAVDFCGLERSSVEIWEGRNRHSKREREDVSNSKKGD